MSPYTKTAGNVDAAVMALLQDWASRLHTQRTDKPESRPPLAGHIWTVATSFALPQIAIVKPRLVICLGLATFTAVSLACGHSVPLNMATAIESPFRYEDSLIYCQSHPGHFGRINRNRGGIDRVSQDWLLMRERTSKG